MAATCVVSWNATVVSDAFLRRSAAAASKSSFVAVFGSSFCALATEPASASTDGQKFVEATAAAVAAPDVESEPPPPQPAASAAVAAPRTQATVSGRSCTGIASGACERPASSRRDEPRGGSSELGDAAVRPPCSVPRDGLHLAHPSRFRVEEADMASGYDVEADLGRARSGERYYPEGAGYDDAARGAGWLTFATIMLALSGTFSVIDGIVAVCKSR